MYRKGTKKERDRERNITNLNANDQARAHH